MVELKKLPAGFAEFVIRHGAPGAAGQVAEAAPEPLALMVAESPVRPRSPSMATSPRVVLTGPLLGVVNPDSGMSTGGPLASTNRKPVNIVRLRIGWVASS